MPSRRTLRLGLPVLGITAAFMATTLTGAGASSHREAPLITEDPVADNTDTYAYVAPDAPDAVTIVANWIPLEEPAGGPNFHKFGDDVLYEINIDNNGDAVDNVVYQFRFHTTVKNPNTFLYNTGPVTSLDDPDLNVVQTYSVTEVRNGVKRVLGSDIQVAPANVGQRSTPNYEQNLGEKAVRTIEGGIKVFAGPRDDPFFVDLGSAFDLLGLRPLNEAHAIPRPAAKGRDNVQGYNVHSIVLQVPKARIVNDSDPVLGIYSTTYRRQNRVFKDGNGAVLTHSGPWVQVSRLGMPLVNEVVVPLGVKDTFNATDPAHDVAAGFGPAVLDPEPARLIPVLYPGVTVPPAPRNDIATIFLTGIPGLNKPAGDGQPSEMIRLNTSIAPTPYADQDRLGLLAGQNDGFPNGRRLGDDVVDIELRALAGGTPFTPDFNHFPNNALTDGVDKNDTFFRQTFPYLAAPWGGYQILPHHS